MVTGLSPLGTMIEMAFDDWLFTAATVLPQSTWALANPEPVMTTSLPPSDGPDDGETLAISGLRAGAPPGAAAGVGGVRENVSKEPDSATARRASVTAGASCGASAREGP